jgi:hypothetical protein
MVVFFPVLTQLEELRSFKVLTLGLAVQRVSSELLLDDRLGRDACMVTAGDVERCELPHSMPPDQSVLERECKGMSDVQLASHLEMLAGVDMATTDSLTFGGGIAMTYLPLGLSAPLLSS